AGRGARQDRRSSTARESATRSSKVPELTATAARCRTFPPGPTSVARGGQAESLEQVRAGEASDRGDAIAGDGKDHDPVSVAARGLVGQVGGQRRVPVGAGADQADDVEAAAGGDGGEEAGYLSAAGDRGEHGWHGQDHVLAEQRGQGINVAALPRVDEPVQELPLVIIQPHAGGYGRRGPRSGQGRTGALHGAVDRWDADVQQRGCLGG